MTGNKFPAQLQNSAIKPCFILQEGSSSDSDGQKPVNVMTTCAELKPDDSHCRSELPHANV